MRENIKNVQIYYLSENQLLIAKPRSLSGILFNMYTAEDRAQSYDASAGAFFQHPLQTFSYRRCHGKQTDAMNERANEGVCVGCWKISYKRYEWKKCCKILNIFVQNS